MEEGNISQSLPGQRTLAAIVFTDIVGFSAKMGKDEERTLALVRRDLDFMKDLCGRYEGQVLKSTGDGLLFFFGSAVQAVACSLEIQKSLARRARTLPPADVLQHRIGIHLGDVFVRDRDVMGDGVNIAARLQAEAEPGGICISQTVYDVVKNRLGIQTTYLGPRELKNIQEAVPVYRVLLAAHDKRSATPGFAGAKRKFLGRMAVAAVAALVLGIILAAVLGRFAARAKTSEPTAADSADEVLPSSPVGERMQKLTAFKRRYDFEGLVDWVRTSGEIKDESLRGVMIKRYERLAFLLDWFKKELDQRSRNNPLAVKLPKGFGIGEAGVWGTKQDCVAVDIRGRVRERELATLEPAFMAAMINAAIVDTQSIEPPRRKKLSEATLLFAREYRLGKVMRFTDMPETPDTGK